MLPFILSIPPLSKPATYTPLKAKILLNNGEVHIGPLCLNPKPPNDDNTLLGTAPAFSPHRCTPPTYSSTPRRLKKRKQSYSGLITAIPYLRVRSCQPSLLTLITMPKPIVLHIGEPIKYNHDFYAKDFLSRFDVVCNEGPDRASFIQALKDKKCAISSISSSGIVVLIEMGVDMETSAPYFVHTFKLAARWANGMKNL